MTENQQTPPTSDTDKLASVLAELERERQKRVDAGQWSKGVRPVLMAIPQAGETLEAAQQREVHRYLAADPSAPKAIAAYDWLAIEVIDPAPVVETQPYAPDHADAVDVTPQPYRPPMPPAPAPPPSSSRSLPPPPGSLDPRNVNIPPSIYSAEQRRTQNFNDDTWGDPTGWPIRYPKGRTGY